MSIMTRSAAQFWLNVPINGVEREPFIVPKNVHHYYKNLNDTHWRVWTWEDEFNKRREKQARELQNKRFSYEPRKTAALVWVFFNTGWIMGGWYIYIITLKNRYSLNFTRDRVYPELIQDIMETYPCGVFPVKENIDTWCEAFAKAYPTRSFNGRKRQGVIKCWVEIDSQKNINLLK